MHVHKHNYILFTYFSNLLKQKNRQTDSNILTCVVIVLVFNFFCFVLFFPIISCPMHVSLNCYSIIASEASSLVMSMAHAVKMYNTYKLLL